jgi:PleD family two-component response regulator
VGQEIMATGNGDKRKRILVIGSSTPLMEGVSDLLQVDGYPVDVSSTLAETEYALNGTLPDLVLVEFSSATPDIARLAEQIRLVPQWSDVPILYVSFSGDDHIRELQRHHQRNGDKRLHFYAHTLLSMDGLMDQVRTCLA